MKSLQSHYRPLYAAKLFWKFHVPFLMQIHTSSLLSLSCFHFNGFFFYFEIKVNTDEKSSISLFSCLSILSFSASTHVVWDILIQIRYFNTSKMTYFLRKGFLSNFMHFESNILSIDICRNWLSCWELSRYLKC